LTEKLKLKTFLKTDCTRVALTTNCWTSIQNLSYLVITAYFIGNDGNYQKRIISFILVPNHKEDTIERNVEEVLREWGIRNVSTVASESTLNTGQSPRHIYEFIESAFGRGFDMYSKLVETLFR
jgi:hypothetical protein